MINHFGDREKETENYSLKLREIANVLKVDIIRNSGQ